MNIIKYITQDREAGNYIDEFATREEAEAAIRAYEEEDRANDCYEEDFYSIKEPVYATDCGDYTLIAHIAEGGEADEHVDIYIGRAADGHCDMIVSDNASMWVVGNEDDADINRSHWDLIAERIGDIDFNVIRAIDTDLADWLENRKAESGEEVRATTYEVWRVPNGCYDDWRKGITADCKWIGDGFEHLKDAQELRNACADDDERYACTHQIAKTVRDADFNLISFELA
jgi:hypothetical protein